MAHDILVRAQTNTPPEICFRDVTDFSPAAASDLRYEGGTPTYAQLDMTSVADAAARQSAKVDLGAVRADMYSVRCAVELAATPTAGDTIEFYWASSAHSTAASGNLGGVSGSDAAYSGVDSDLARSVLQLQYIGVHICTNDPTGVIQTSLVGFLNPPTRYGSLVVKNESAAAFHNDAVETHIVFDPIIPQIQ
jgi:hypothetical protein